MTTRRQFLLATASSALGVRLAAAQSRSRVGIVAGIPREKSLATRVLLERLAELGYREGTTISVEYRNSARVDRHPALAREMIERRCDVIFAIGQESMARALRDARTSVPVVLIATEYDPVESGIVESFARPGGNITGVYAPISALLGKRVEIAQEILPKADRFLVLADDLSKRQLDALRIVGRARGLQLTVAEFAQPPYDFASAFEDGRRAGVQGVLLLTSPEFLSSRKEITALLEQHRLPAFAPDALADLPGVLASYSIDTRKFIRRAAELGERILKGVKADENPLEQPDEYTILLNLRTARALSIKVPYSVVSRAT